jgi:CBS domain-containing protein
MSGARDQIGTLVRDAPIAVAEKLTLRTLAAVLAADQIGAALVERDDGTIGIVSERDIMRALADDADPDVVWSADVMTEPLVEVRTDESVIAVADRMIDKGIRHVAVVDGDGIVGVVSLREVSRVLASELRDSW